MTPTREAVVLPAIFLTVALFGGLRIGGAVQLLPPPVIALVLGLLLLGALVRAGVLAPDRLMHARRSPMENASGAMVLLSLFAASAQVFNMVIPDRGLLHVVFGVFFFVQLLTTLAGVTGRKNLLRSLTVLLAGGFLLRFIVLDSLYAPDGGLMKRVLTTLLEGVSLGAIDYQPNAAATGYVAFFTLLLYLIGLLLLPSSRRPAIDVRALRAPARTALLLLAIAACGLTGCASYAREQEPSGATEKEIRAARLREDALRSARVWQAPATPIAEASLAENPAAPGGFSSTADVSCHFALRKMGSGLTPKFYCEMPDGTVLKVKYGAANGELHAEVAGTRLLSALGFGADRMYVVRSVRCAGCPLFPFSALKCFHRTGMRACFLGGLKEERVRDFDPVVIERPIEGRTIEATDDQGWAWYELDKIDPAAGGSSLAEVDALRLLAVVLAHWDNKASNQRLVCLPGGDRPDGGCVTPFALVQDLGATFGPTRIDLRNWRATPVWTDRATCTVSMKMLPYRGATFPERRISEEGRVMLAGLLEQLSSKQLADLFTGSRIVSYDQILAEARSADAWISTFKDKVRQIREGGPCPQSTF